MSRLRYTFCRLHASLTHITPGGNAAMVDVTPKPASVRMATASAKVRVGGEIFGELGRSSAQTAKGNVFTTAQLAGIQAAKQTASLIPLCHPLSLSHISVECSLEEPETVGIMATAKTTGATGVEMEALTAASVAALTVYDMCKAMSHDMEISIRLESKRGGRSDFSR